MKRKRYTNDIPKTTSLTIADYRDFLEWVQDIELKDKVAVREGLKEGLKWWNKLEEMKVSSMIKKEPEKGKLLKNELRYLKERIYILETAEKKAKWM